MAADENKRSRQDSLPDGKLPGDIMVSILINLPVKSLIKFQAVSKSWCRLISSTRFFKLHLHRQSLVAPNNCLLSLGEIDYEEGDDDLDLEFGLLDLTDHYDSPDVADDDVSMLVDGVPPFDHHLGLRDCCNGLVCFKTAYSDIILWNPATRKHRSLDVPKSLNFYTLGLCYVDDDFKILVWTYIRVPEDDPFNTYDTPPYLYVYSLSTDSWDKFDLYPRKTKIYFNSPTFMGTCMHWLSHRCCPNGSNGSKCTCSSATEIVVFDVVNRVMSCFNLLPVSCGRHELEKQHTLVIGGCLCIMIYYDTDGGGDDDVDDDDDYGIGVWVMEQYGVEGSWVQRYFIQDEECTVCRFFPIVWNDGEIVFNDDDTEDLKVLIFYDPNSGNKRYVEFSSYYLLKFFKYVESLASVGLVEDEVEEGDC